MLNSELEKFISIIWHIIKNPYEYFSYKMPKDKTIREPLIFAVIISTISTLIFSFAFAFTSQIGVVQLINLLFITPISTVAIIYINAFLIHGVIFLFCPKRSNFTNTLKVFAYSSATTILLIIPVIGMSLFIIFQVRAIIFGLSAVHNVSAFKIFILFVIISITIIIAIAFFVVTVLGTAIMPFYNEFLSSLSIKEFLCLLIQ